MAKAPEFDVQAAHKYFAAHWFNSAWDLIEKQGRTAEDDRMMVALNQASIFHWSRRPDNDDKNRSIGYWQASRIQSLLGNAAESSRHAEVCLTYSRDLEPFYLGYAYEALARAAKVAGDAEKCSQYLAAAEENTRAVTRQENRALLEADLASLR